MNYPRGYRAPTPKARDWLLRLVAERRFEQLGTCGEERLENVGAMLEDRRLDARRVSELIDQLRVAPFDDDDVVGPGVYRRNGTIYVVRRNRTNERLHARRLVEIGGRRLTEADTVVQIEFEYDRDALRELEPADQMTLEEARPFIIRYGRCIFCNTPLKDATSVERGVGPVCIKRYAPARPAPTVPAATRAALSDLLSSMKGT